MTTPNELIAGFIDRLPSDTQGNVAAVVMMLVKPQLIGEQNADWLGELKAVVTPATSEDYARFELHGAAVISAGLLDYYFSRFGPDVTSADLKRMHAEMEAERGYPVSGISQRLAETQDARNADFHAAAKEWRELRNGPLSNESLQREFFRWAKSA